MAPLHLSPISSHLLLLQLLLSFILVSLHHPTLCHLIIIIMIGSANNRINDNNDKLTPVASRSTQSVSPSATPPTFDPLTLQPTLLGKCTAVKFAFAQHSIRTIN